MSEQLKLRQDEKLLAEVARRLQKKPRQQQTRQNAGQ